MPCKQEKCHVWNVTLEHGIPLNMFATVAANEPVQVTEMASQSVTFVFDQFVTRFDDDIVFAVPQECESLQ